MIVTVVVVSMVGIIAFGLLATGKTDFLNENVARNELREATSYSKLLASSKCLSTGEVGIMDHNLMELNNGTPRMDCVYHPSLWTYIVINDTEENDKYIFGSPGVKSIIDRSKKVDGEDVEKNAKNSGHEEFKVGIKEGGEVRLGLMDIYYLRPPTTLVSISRAAHIAWENESSINNFPIMGPKEKFTLTFNETGVCETINPGTANYFGPDEQNTVCRDIPMSWIVKKIHVKSEGKRGQQTFNLHVEKVKMCAGRTFLNFTVTELVPPS